MRETNGRTIFVLFGTKLVCPYEFKDGLKQ